MKDTKIKTNKKRLQIRTKKIPPFQIPLAICYRIMLFLITSLIIIFTMLFAHKPYILGLAEGDISARDIYAPFNFEYIKGEDKKLTEEKRQKAAQQAGEVYIHQSITSELIRKLDNIFKTLDKYRQGEQLDFEDPMIKKIVDFIGSRKLKILIASDISREKLLKTLKSIIEDLDRNYYIISSQDLIRLKSDQARKLYIKEENETKVVSLSAEELIELKKLRQLIQQKITKELPYRRGINQIIAELTISFLKPSLLLDVKLTQELKEKAFQQVEPVYIKGEVKKNEKIISRGERIKRQDLLKLKRLSEIQGKTNTSLVWGLGIISLLLLILVALFLKFYDNKFYRDNSKLTLIALVLILVVVLAKLIIFLKLTRYLVPVATGAMLLTMLCSPTVAIKITIVSAFLAGIIGGNDLAPAISFLLGGLIAIIAVRNIRRRSQLLKAGFLVGSVQFLVILAMNFITANFDYQLFIREAGFGFLNGLISAFLTLGLLPFFEHAFRLVTNISLLELSDLNHPLLRQLLTKAPGTYHHSLIVSQLAEQAAEAIGVNALLARVGAYFHDIGKMEKPQYFSENINEKKKKKSKHEKLSPSMSSLIIINHVKIGVELARKYKLPQAIIDFIEQHHGTSLVYFFYHKALEKATEDIKEEQFRYSGPKPQSKETATVLLADAVEAASRTLSEATPAKVKRLVLQIIDAKFMEGELDECDLTLKNLHTIASVFTRILTSIYHTRVEYPRERVEKTA